MEQIYLRIAKDDGVELRHNPSISPTEPTTQYGPKSVLTRRTTKPGVGGRPTRRQRGYGQQAATGCAIACTLLGLTGASAAAFEFGLYRDRPIQLERSTKVDFDFVESHSPYLSEFGVLNLDTQEKIPLLEQTQPFDDGATASSLSPFVSDLNSQDDYLGTPGQSVPQPHSNFIFEAGTRYTLYLTSKYQGRDAGTVYLMDELHDTRSQLSLVEGAPEDLCTGKGNLLLWDDTGSLLGAGLQHDRDFDDFVVQVRVWCNLAVAPVQTTASLSVSGPVVAASSVPLGLSLAPLAAAASFFVSQASATQSPPSSPQPSLDLAPQLPLKQPLPEPPTPKSVETVPEPSALLGLGLAGLSLGWHRRRRTDPKH